VGGTQREKMTAVGSPHGSGQPASDPDPSRGWSGSTQDLLVLGSAQLFRGLEPGDVAALLPAFGVRTLERGATLFRQGDVGDAQVFIVLQGRFTVAREHRAGRSVSAVLGPGDMAGELSVFDPGPRTSTLTATTPARVAVLSAPDLLAWGTSRPRVARRLLQVLARRLRRTGSTAIDLVFVDVPGRVASTLLELAGRFGEPRGAQLWVAHGLTQTELAQLVGSSRETVNRVLGQFAARGWLQLERGGVVLTDIPRLRQRAGAATGSQPGPAPQSG